MFKCRNDDTRGFGVLREGGSGAAESRAIQILSTF